MLITTFIASPFMRFLKILTRVNMASRRTENADSGPGATAQGVTGAPTPPGPTSPGLWSACKGLLKCRPWLVPHKATPEVKLLG